MIHNPNMIIISGVYSLSSPSELLIIIINCYHLLGDFFVPGTMLSVLSREVTELSQVSEVVLSSASHS